MEQTLEQVAPENALLPKLIASYRIVDAWRFGKTLRGWYLHVTRRGPGRKVLVEIQTDGTLAVVWGRNFFGANRPVAPLLDPNAKTGHAPDMKDYSQRGGRK